MLDHLDEIAASGEGFDPLSVRLAAWFHDAVYDGERDAEERSATWAEESLVGLVDDACLAEVARLVRLTEHHRPEPGDSAGAALSDADLAILAAPAERYAAYVAAVRREYAHPLYTPASVAAQARLPEIDTDRVAFAGAYHGWGFHEDGARSGLRAAERLGLTWDDDVPPDPRTPTAEGGSAVGVRGLASAQEADA